MRLRSKSVSLLAFLMLGGLSGAVSCASAAVNQASEWANIPPAIVQLVHDATRGEVLADRILSGPSPAL